MVIQEYQQMDRVLKEERTYAVATSQRSAALCNMVYYVARTTLGLATLLTQQAMPLTLCTCLTIDGH